MLRRFSRLHLRRRRSNPRRFMASPPLPSPFAFSGGDGTAVLAPQPDPQAGTPQGEDGDPAPPAAWEDVEFGFQRPEFGTNPLVGTVQPYDRHLFLCYKSPEVWPRNVEGSDSDRLPRLLAAEIKASNSSFDKKTRLTVCQGEDGTDFSNGDVLIFPDMIRYRQLTHFDVEPFVDEVLKKNSEWTPKPPEPLSGSYIFVCAHGSRDRRCGVCGPVLIKRFQEEISSRGLQSEVFISPCSHVGGHKYAGNVIIFSPTVSEAVSGHWYGYVTPEDVPTLLEQHIGKGKIVEHLWRGQMGLSEEEQKATLNLLKVQLNEGLDENRRKEYINTSVDGGNNAATPVAGCCQGNSNATCCQVMPTEKLIVSKTENESTQVIERESDNKLCDASNNHGPRARKLYKLPTWFESWEREDAYAAAAVVAAIASVAVAYSYYRQPR
ncbi:uncharacterized protein LOC121976707 [Zingiber officinale]|uniref:Uncharacterized protein n=1 Tax=Zingiber officinale TaxID=94328 RepID=A0A8J5L516_ZINOF|nr:uncharacterized protein LOC121976707 [Zingiber officinale]KAG6512455.1 hypothetical protein ZIOFF_030566 [Zingiber officinale]